MVYPYVCGDCGEERNEVRLIEDRDAPAFCVCGSPMKRVFCVPYLVTRRVVDDPGNKYDGRYPLHPVTGADMKTCPPSEKQFVENMLHWDKKFQATQDRIAEIRKYGKEETVTIKDSKGNVSEQKAVSVFSSDKPAKSISDYVGAA